MAESHARHPIVELTRARILEMLREPEVIFWVFFFPILMTVALGIAFRGQGPQPVAVGVVEGRGSADVVTVLQQSTEIVPRSVPAADADIALRDGKVALVVVPGTPPTYRYDPTRPESRLARLAVDGALQRAHGRADMWRAEEQQVVAPGSRYIDWLVPGLIGMNIMGTGMWGIGFAIVGARTRKLLKRLIATPMRHRDYLLSHVCNRLIFLAVEVIGIVGFAWVAFAVPVRGSVLLLGAVSLVGALAFGGLGLLVASRVRTIEAVSGLLNVVMVPMWILSGVFFSAEHFPAVMQPIIKALPLTALNDALRAVMIDGAGVTRIVPELGILLTWMLVAFTVALRIFRWR